MRLIKKIAWEPSRPDCVIRRMPWGWWHKRHPRGRKDAI